MTPEEKQLLERAVSLSEENNEILRGIRRANRWGIAYNIFYWVAVIGISYGAYVYIQPYIDRLLDTYNSIMGTTTEVQKVGSQIPDLGKVMNSLPR